MTQSILIQNIAAQEASRRLVQHFTWQYFYGAVIIGNCLSGFESIQRIFADLIDCPVLPENLFSVSDISVSPDFSELCDQHFGGR